MRLDTNEPIGTGYTQASAMRHVMITIAQHTKTRGQQQHWAEHLRFLTPSEYEANDFDDSSQDESDTDFCTCNDLDHSLFTAAERSLRLTKSSDTPGCVHYVAVSYCWASTANAEYTGAKEFSIESLDGEVRPPYCPSSLVDRVVQYAAWKQCAFIWVDQECILQDDVGDKTVGVDAMDIVYQQATFSLAVLEVRISEQQHIDALEMMLESSPELAEESKLIDACTALVIIMTDPWFERAWCLQESTSGNRQMTLLLRCDDQLAIPDILSSAVAGCFELDLTTVHLTVASSLQEAMISAADNLTPSTEQMIAEVTDQWFENMPPDVQAEYNHTSRTACNAAQALAYLDRRKNSVVSDRLAILANLCHYEIRLDGETLDSLGFGFSICAMVLAALNGDFSLQLGHDDYAQTNKSGRKSQLQSFRAFGTTETKAFTWSLPFTACLRDLSYLDHDVTPLRQSVLSTSLTRGLHMEGCIWISDRFIDLPTLALNFQHRQCPENMRSGVDTDDTPQSEYNRAFLVQLICTLTAQGFNTLVSLLWDTFRLRPTANQVQEGGQEVAEYANAALSEILDLRTGQIKWLNPISTRSKSVVRTHPFQNLGQQPAMYFLADKVLNTGGLLAARPWKEEASCTAVFEGSHIGGLVFTPRSNGELRTPKGYGWYPSNWAVKGGMFCDDDPLSADGRSSGYLQESSGDGEVIELRCDRPVCGIWRADERFAQQVLLQ